MKGNTSASVGGAGLTDADRGPAAPLVGRLEALGHRRRGRRHRHRRSAGDLAIAGGVVRLYFNRPHLTEQEDATRNCTGIAIIPLVSGDTLGMTVTVSH